MGLDAGERAHAGLYGAPFFTVLVQVLVPHRKLLRQHEDAGVFDEMTSAHRAPSSRIAINRIPKDASTCTVLRTVQVYLLYYCS